MPHTFGGITGYDGEIAFVTDWYKKRVRFVLARRQHVMSGLASSSFGPRARGDAD